MSQKTDTGGLSISAVSRLIGVPADTLRTWERRYAVVSPGRDASGRRIYLPTEVQRLRAIAQLVSRGERVAELSRLTDEALRERVEVHQIADAAPNTHVRAVVIHPTLGGVLGGVTGEGDGRLDVVAWKQRVQDLGGVAMADVLVCDHELLGASPEKALGRLSLQSGISQVVVCFHFLSRMQRKQLSQPGVRLVQGPITALDLRRIVVDHARVAMLPTLLDGRAPPFRYSRAQLEELVNIRPELDCECPRHLASLVLSLRAFEIYSSKCESQSVEDAALHATLADRTGEVRAVLEQLLAQVCAHDGIEV